MNRISEDVSRVRMYIGPAVMYTTINLAVLFILIIISMLQVNVKLLFVLAPLPLLSISIYYVSDLMNKKSEEVQSNKANFQHLCFRKLLGIPHS